jgi:hypothetical protein
MRVVAELRRARPDCVRVGAWQIHVQSPTRDASRHERVTHCQFSPFTHLELNTIPVASRPIFVVDRSPSSILVFGRLPTRFPSPAADRPPPALQPPARPPAADRVQGGPMFPEAPPTLAKHRRPPGRFLGAVSIATQEIAGERDTV